MKRRKTRCGYARQSKNITYIRTEDIDGYSTSLVDFAGGTLLGIGYGTWDSLKIEVYAEDGDSVRPLDAYEAENASFASEYKAYLIDRENALVGLHVSPYNGENYYLLLRFDGYELVELAKVKLASDLPDLTRAAVVDGWLYIFTADETDFTAVQLYR